MSISYLSTRGSAPALSFTDTVMAGLAADGGLYVPSEIPTLSMAEIHVLRAASYPELAFAILSRFTEGSLDAATLRSLIDEAYRHFRHPAIAPLKQLGSQHFLLELFHGPTLAFKDFALQFLGPLLGHVLAQKKKKVVVIGATSGDTGSAAIAGCRGRERMDIVILHPHGRVSPVQRRQMTTLADKNVHNIAIEGTFDDCQDIVKALFGDAAFREARQLTAVNSINWARILAQVVYYFYAALALGAPAREVSFSVPTGNFGDIYAGYIAKRMGLPVEKLIIATNRNDILARTLASGTYGMQGVVPTLSPSMDIQISSNFERLLFELYDRDGATIAALMQDFRRTGTLSLSATALSRLRADFAAGACDDEETKATIARIQRDCAELLDPHTACGVAVGERLSAGSRAPLVTLATAHPAKFPDAVKSACGLSAPLPAHMADLFEKEERFSILPNSAAAVAAYIDKICQ